MKRKLDEVSYQAARKYASQFKHGRKCDTLSAYARADFLAGVEWHKAQTAATRKPIEPVYVSADEI